MPGIVLFGLQGAAPCNAALGEVCWPDLFVVFCLQINEINPLIPTLKPQSNGPLYSNTVVGTLAVDGWAVTFGTARRALASWGPIQSPSRCTNCNSPPINGQCVNFILFDVTT